jgi:hypothetical protein
MRDPMILRGLHAVLIFMLHLGRRFGPFFRPARNRLLRDPMAAAIQGVSARR